VFNGGWTLEAAEAVCNPDGDLDVLDLTATLVEQSLVYTMRGRDEPRFTMLETIRQYARDRADEAGELVAMRDARSDYFLAVIDNARSRLRSGDQERVLNQLEDDAGNLRSMMKWCLVSGRAGDAANASWTLWHYWWLRDRFEEGLSVTADILESDELTDLERTRAIVSRGGMAFWRGDYVETLNLVGPAIEEFRRLGDIEGIALCQLSLAIIGGILVGPEEAVSRFDEAREIFTKLDDKWGYILANNAEGWLRVGLHLDIEPESYEDTLKLALEVGTDIEIAMASGNLGAIRIRQNRLEESRSLLRTSIELLARYRIRHMATFTMDQTAELAMVEGKALVSARLLGAAEAIRERTGAPLPPVQGMYREQTLERGVELVGEEAFNESLEAGADLTFEEAVAEAIAHLSGSPR
jgi:tetratricopeptide (TPR) repeat protein